MSLPVFSGLELLRGVTILEVVETVFESEMVLVTDRGRLRLHLCMVDYDEPGLLVYLEV